MDRTSPLYSSLSLMLLLTLLSGCGSKNDGGAPSSSDKPGKAAQKTGSTKTADLAKFKKLMTPVQLEMGGPVVNSVGMVLVPIPAGEFQMGEKGIDRAPPHPVKLTKPFYCGAYEVTHAQYKKVVGEVPTGFVSRDNLPVDSADWKDADMFCRKLSELAEEKQAGRVYRLPTEAEWEYACRAGSTTTFSFGNDPNKLGDYAWFLGNSNKEPRLVGQKLPNAWGLFDMHGNVFEWCSDYFGDYPAEAVTDPQGPSAKSENRVVRGGCYDSDPKRCRSAERIYRSSGFRFEGFRVVMIVSSDKK